MMFTKKVLKYFLLFFGIILRAGAAGGDQRVLQEIRYINEDVSEIYIVWGINNWNLPPEDGRPPGSFVKDNLVYSPMIVEEDACVVRIKTDPGTQIDYVFWITKGIRNAATDIWDTNTPEHKDYHSVVLQDNIVVVPSRIKARPTGELSIFDFSAFLFCIAALFLFVFFILRRLKIISRKSFNPYHFVLAIALSSLLLLFLIRPSVLGISWDIYLKPFENVSALFAGLYYDLLYIFVLAVIFFLAVFLTRRTPGVQRFFSYLFLLIGVISVVSASMNIRIVEMLGKPFNYQWLYYSDFLKSPDSKAAMSANVSPEYFLDLAFIVVTFLIINFLFYNFCLIVLPRVRSPRMAISLSFCLLLVFFFWSKRAISANKWHYEKLANPVTAFLESVNPFAAPPSLFTMVVPDSLQFRSSSRSQLRWKSPLPCEVKNILIVVLESTPAEYVQPYGSKYRVTPFLDKYSKNAVIFKNIYAHAPATNLSMVSLLGSIYPWLSYNSLTQEHPDLEIPSISSELNQKGYRTAFFNSADNRFQKAGEFLKYRAFDSITDCNHNSCPQQGFSVKSDWEYMDGKDDECTGDELISWIKNDRSIPFLGVMWTYQTHYPYFFSGEEQVYETEDASLNKYLNALNHGDKVFGKIMQALDSTGLSRSTMVVVVGDHGEAFGRHDQVSHGRKIYEENLHIPCMIIHPSFEKREIKDVGGLVDIAPTIFSLLEIKPPEQWQGTNLFLHDQSSRAYFFAPWSDYLFGYRENNKKYIYNATKNTTEIYDLNDDPLESKNLSEFLPDEVNLSHKRLAAWAQYVNNQIELMLQKSDEVKLKSS